MSTSYGHGNSKRRGGQEGICEALIFGSKGRLTFSFLGLFGILTVLQGLDERSSVMLFPELEHRHSVCLGYHRMAILIGCRRAHLPSNDCKDFCDWPYEGLVRMVKLDVGEEVLESSQQQKARCRWAVLGNSQQTIISKGSGSPFPPFLYTHQFVTYDVEFSQYELDTHIEATAFT